MFTGCHFAILFLKEHKFSDILIFIGRLFHILFPTFGISSWIIRARVGMSSLGSQNSF